MFLRFIQKNKYDIFWHFKTLICFALLFLPIFSLEAASLSLLSPGAVDVGNIITVKVFVNTEGKIINSADAIVQFPSDLLEVVSINKGNSIFSIWVEEPKFSNTGGTVSFTGGVPNPGFTGGGDIASIIFKAKKTGTASIVFGDSAVRQNDGLGTDILSKKIGSDIKISGGIDDTSETFSEMAPLLPVINSPTHPDQNRWYKNNDIEFNWDVPSDVVAVETSISSKPLMPTVVYDYPLKSKKINNFEDGVWYFNLRFKNASGWGPAGHYKVQIDTIPPDPFKITLPHGDNTEDPRPVILFSTKDKGSGIDSYEVKIGENEFQKIQSESVDSNPFSPAPQDPGVHGIFVKAVDRAGNETVQYGQFTISALNSPRITDYPEELKEGDFPRIVGVTYPQTRVEVVIENSSGKKDSQIGHSFVDGTFTMTWSKRLEIGSYKLSARAINEKEARSEFSEPIVFSVVRSPLAVASGLIFNWLSVLIIAVLFIGAFVMLVLYFIIKIKRFKRIVKMEIKGAESSVHRSFTLLKESVKRQIKNLEKAKSRRQLTDEEECLIKNLQQNLDESERYLEEEISSIEDKLS